VFFFGTFIVSQSMIRITGGFQERGHFVPGPDGQPGQFIQAVAPTSTPTGSQIAGMLNPANLLEGLRVWIVGHTDSNRPRDVPYPSTLGPVYLIVALALFALCALLLIRRYRKAGLL
jgi:ABC-2 type transport system permease protein